MARVKLILVLVLLSIGFTSKAQIKIYRTYLDYTSQNVEQYDTYNTYSLTLGKAQLHLKNGDDKVKIWCRDIWGFEYRGATFRVDKENERPVRVMNEGKIVYYENGLEHLTMLRDNQNPDYLSAEANEYLSYFSESINSPIIPVPRLMMIKGAKKLQLFEKENEEYKELFECIGNDHNYLTIRSCVEAFEED